MNIQSLIKFGFMASVFLGVMTVGMRVGPGELRYLLTKPALLCRALLAMHVLAPIVTVLICKAFALHPAVTIALVTLATAPVSAMFSQAMLPLVAPAHAAYARGLFFASTVLSVILTPLVVEVVNASFGGHVQVLPLDVAKVVIGSVLLPLAIGLVIGRWRPAAARWIPAIQKASTVVLVVCAVLLIAGAWAAMASIFRPGTLGAIVLIALIGLAIGHFLGGPEEDDRTVLGLATVTRHPGVALVVASLTDQRAAPAGVLLVMLVSSLAALPYKRWRKRLRAAAAVQSPAAADPR